MGHKTRGGRHTKEAYAAESIRQQISTEAARLMAAEGVHDFQLAKRKAALRLNLPASKHLPSNQEIETALRQYLELFHARRLAQTLQHMRRIALEAMRFLHRFEPLLVGPVLSGTVTPTSAIQFHVSADTAEEVDLWLQEHGIPFEHSERRLRFGGDRYEMFPAYCFTADNITIELCVFNRRHVREAPLSPVDGKPMKRANLKEVEELLRKAC